MKIKLFDNNIQIGNYVAYQLINKIQTNPNLVLGLATGSSPLTTYKSLIKQAREKNISFKNVKVFNLDEYLNARASDTHSYAYFMQKELFKHIDIKKENTFIPDERFAKNPLLYDQLIDFHGGIDVQILGLGSNGHIAFNEPGSNFKSLTSIVNLTKSTINDNARFFKNKNEVPRQAISMGIGSILKAKEIILIAYGENKKNAVYQLLYGETSSKWPCTALKDHPNLIVVLDKKAYGLDQ